MFYVRINISGKGHSASPYPFPNGDRETRLLVGAPLKKKKNFFVIIVITKIEIH